MKAIHYRTYGGADVLQETELPDPTPAPGQLLVRVRAASVNPVDWKIASGKYRPLMSAKLPQIPGFDVSGEVVSIGAGVTGFPVGARVHARLSGGIGASCAELTVASPLHTTQMPDNMDFATGAGLPLAGMTALQGLRDGGGMPLAAAKQRVLVIGASGGVGHLAIQIARAASATVIGVCGARNQALVKSLGADEVIDYQKPDAFRDLAPCDIILDCVGNPYGPWLPRLTEDGRFVSVHPRPKGILRGLLNPICRRKVHSVMLKSNAPDLRILDDLFSAGKLRVVIDQRFPLAQLKAAWDRSMSGRAVGKIIIDVAATP